MHNQKDIPALRFPEFDVEWHEALLGDQFFNRKEPGNYLCPIYSVTIDRGMVPRDSLERNIGNDADSDDNLFVKSNDLAYNMMRLWQGAIGLAEQDCMISPAYVVLGPYENVFSKFFIYLFERKRSLYLFTSNSYGLTSDRLRMYYKDFSRIKFATPLYPEQQKVATFLTSVDEKLTQLIKKKSMLEKYKKGVMQKIFSQEIRFKDEHGQDYTEWVDTKLGEIGIFSGGGTPSTKNTDFWMGSIPWISSSDLVDDSIFKISTARFITKAAVSQSAAKIIPPKSVLIVSRVGVGKVAVNEVELCTSQDFTNIIPNSDNPIFIAYLVKFKTNKLLGLNQGTCIKGFVKSDLETMNIFLPSVAEQTKIATFLSAIDDKINHCSVQIEKMGLWKKGLLQKMFC